MCTLWATYKKIETNLQQFGRIERELHNFIWPIFFFYVMPDSESILSCILFCGRCIRVEGQIAEQPKSKKRWTNEAVDIVEWVHHQAKDHKPLTHYVQLMIQIS